MDGPDLAEDLREPPRNGRPAIVPVEQKDAGSDRHPPVYRRHGVGHDPRPSHVRLSSQIVRRNAEHGDKAREPSPGITPSSSPPRRVWRGLPRHRTQSWSGIRKSLETLSENPSTSHTVSVTE